MAQGPITQLKDVVKPEIFIPQMQIRTAENVDFLRSGAMTSNQTINSALRGAGQTFNLPAYNDLDQDDELIATDAIPAGYTGGVANPDPKKITTLSETAFRMMRNQTWGYSRLIDVLTGEDPGRAIMNRIADYWALRIQETTIKIMQGIFANNAANPANGSTHKKDDMTVDMKGAAYDASKTSITGEGVLSALHTMGDAAGKLRIMVIHSAVYQKLQNRQLIAFTPESDGLVNFGTYMNRRIIVSDAMPSDGGVFETWFFGEGALGYGNVPPANALVVVPKEEAGNASGADVIVSRTQMAIHPHGYSYIGQINQAGGPSNADLVKATNWKRVYPERKQVAIARLITREA